ncbi:hypothetical protein AB5J72_36345 [Streptomyces sp. CG1]
MTLFRIERRGCGCAYTVEGCGCATEALRALLHRGFADGMTISLNGGFHD